MNVAEIVTNEIIAKIQSGNIPWIKPWDGCEPINYITRKPYRGINRILLDGGEYLTFKQIQELNGKVKKGSKSHIVVFYSPIKPKKENEDETEQEKQDKPKFVLKYYRVFSLNDVEGIKSKIQMHDDNSEIPNCQTVMNDYIVREGITLKCNGTSSEAFYSPLDDAITLPNIKQFDNSNHYYATAFHEMGHSTGHKSRLDRLNNKAHFGNEEYSKEELVAEITSAMLCRLTHVNFSEIIEIG